MTTNVANQMKLNDAIQEVSPCLLRQAKKGRVHAVLISSDKQATTLTQAFSALNLPYQSTADMQIFNAVPGFVTFKDEASAKKLNDKMHGLDCQTSRLTLNPKARSAKKVVQQTFVMGGLGYAISR